MSRRREISSSAHAASHVDYYESFVKRDRALKIIKEMSEFLRILDLQETDILKTMIVRFAIESVEASQGALIVYNQEKNILIIRICMSMRIIALFLKVLGMS